MSSCPHSGLNRYLSLQLKAKGDCWQVRFLKKKDKKPQTNPQISFSYGISELEYFYNQGQKLVGTDY